MNSKHPPTEQPLTPQAISERISTYCSTPIQFQQAIVTSNIGGVLTIYQATDSSFMQLLYTQVNAMLFVLRPLDEGGQPFGSLLPIMPRSLAQGQLCRIVWREQTIALSVHLHPAGQDERFSQDIAYMQNLTAMIIWAKWHHIFRNDIIPGEEIKTMSLLDPVDMSTVLATIQPHPPVTDQPREPLLYE